MDEQWEAASEEEAAPLKPIERSADILVETKALVVSVLGIELGESVEAMEVVSTEQLPEHVASPLTSDQSMKALGTSESDVAVSEDLPEHCEWRLAPSLMSSLDSPPHMGLPSVLLTQ